MYRGFELDIDGWDLEDYYDSGLEVFEDQKVKVSNVLDAYLLRNKALDGSRMSADWFPLIDAEVFISHSHRDERLAISLAGWLNDCFGITTFIDSMIWGYSNDLLKEIDKKYCEGPVPNSYSYELRNNSTSHVHIMLATALTKMIDKTECFFFIKTSNSITTKKAINEAETYSPWIYSEVEMARLLRKKPLKEYRNLSDSLIKSFSGTYRGFLNEQLSILHSINLEHLEELSTIDLLLWEISWGKSDIQIALDQLYMNHPIG
jgi:hypothetical protein